MQNPSREPRVKSIPEVIAEKQAAIAAMRSAKTAEVATSIPINTLGSVPQSLLRLIYLDKTAPVRDLFLSRKKDIDAFFNCFDTKNALLELAHLTNNGIGGGEVEPVIPEYYQRVVAPDDYDTRDMNGLVYLPNFTSFDYFPHVSKDTMQELASLPFNGFGFTYTSRVTPGPKTIYNIPSGSLKKYENSDKGFMRHVGYGTIYKEEEHLTEQRFEVKVSAENAESFFTAELKVSAGRVKARKGSGKFESETVQTKTFTLGWAEADMRAELRDFLADQVIGYSHLSSGESAQYFKKQQELKLEREYREQESLLRDRNAIRQGLGLRPIKPHWDGYKWTEV